MSSGSASAGFVFKNFLVFTCCFFDTIVNSWIDHTDYLYDIKVVVALCALQFALRIFSIFLTIFLLWNTFVFRYGLLEMLVTRFKWILILNPLSLIFMLALRIQTVSAVLENKPFMTLWNSTAYFGIYITHNICTIVLFVANVWTCFSLGNPHLYKAQTWLAEQNEEENVVL